MIALFRPSLSFRLVALSDLTGSIPMGERPQGRRRQCSHAHTIAMAGAHNHGANTGGPSKIQGGFVFGNPQGAAVWGRLGPSVHSHAIASDGAHDHGGQTGSASNLPPFYTVLYCQKKMTRDEMAWRSAMSPFYRPARLGQ